LVYQRESKRAAASNKTKSEASFQLRRNLQDLPAINKPTTYVILARIVGYNPFL